MGLIKFNWKANNEFWIFPFSSCWRLTCKRERIVDEETNKSLIDRSNRIIQRLKINQEGLMN